MPPIGPSSELTHAGRPYELTLLVSTVLVTFTTVQVLLLLQNMLKMAHMVDKDFWSLSFRKYIST